MPRKRMTLHSFPSDKHAWGKPHKIGAIRLLDIEKPHISLGNAFRVVRGALKNKHFTTSQPARGVMNPLANGLRIAKLSAVLTFCGFLEFSPLCLRNRGF
jgi:hypothetical protein